MSPGASTSPLAFSDVEPEMNTRSPTRTAREYAYSCSVGRPDEMRVAAAPAPSTASSSISTSISGRLRPLTCTSVAAGRAVRKWRATARATSSPTRMSVTYMRLRTTSSRRPPALPMLQAAIFMIASTWAAASPAPRTWPWRSSEVVPAWSTVSPTRSARE